MGALRVNPNDPFTMMDLAWVHAMLDQHDDAGELMEKARDLAPDDPYTHYLDALVSLRGGNEDDALASLEIAVDKGYSRQMLAADPQLAPLKDNPRFTAIALIR